MKRPLKPVYLDYAATTPVDPRVAHKMSDCLMLDGVFGNPASVSHVYGWEAEELVEEARVNLAELIGADPLEIVWTSGATESDNLAIKGLAAVTDKKHIVTSSYEHKAVLDTCRYLEQLGYQVTFVQPDSDGVIQPKDVEAALTKDTLLVSVMHANNEIGVVNDVDQIGQICKAHNITFHVDAAQSVGKIVVDVSTFDVDLMSISGHKIYGPKGVGALYVRRNPPVKIESTIHGGGHERGMRSGTLATHQIVGLGAAASLVYRELKHESDRILEQRERLWSHLRQVPGAELNGHPSQRVPGILNVSFESVDSETLISVLDDIAVSSGSACTSAIIEPSYVLRELGLSRERAAASIRFSVGRYTTHEEIDYTAQRVAEVVGALRRDA
ncbi:MAG: IscS subfamily cysteine desulfurase [Gammaproteobacteria bacterium]|nr:IscS subfamily cysteine desulfurase [Gammaproteobacteria bacterium]MYF37834.1 IscS subfamily cysteine desulfurase [Gammaproteobacteria bacterium]